MSVFVEAYEQGRQAAFEKFAAGLSPVNIRGAVPRVTGAHGAATVPGQVHPAHAGVPAAQGTPQAPVSAPIGKTTGASGLQMPGWAQKAWGGLNRVAANPVGQMALGTGLMMGMGKLMEPSNSQ